MRHQTPWILRLCAERLPQGPTGQAFHPQGPTGRATPNQNPTRSLKLCAGRLLQSPRAAPPLGPTVRPLSPWGPTGRSRCPHGSEGSLTLAPGSEGSPIPSPGSEGQLKPVPGSEPAPASAGFTDVESFERPQLQMVLKRDPDFTDLVRMFEVGSSQKIPGVRPGVLARSVYELAYES